MLAAAALSGSPAADDFEVRAYVEPEGALSDTRPLRLVIEVNGSRLADVDVGKLPELKNLRVLNGPATARNTRFTMDGLTTRTTASTTLAYTLIPVAPGPAEIPPITVRVGSTSYTTAPIRIEVARAATAPGGGGTQGSRPSREAEEAAGGFDVFLRAEPSAREVFVNQPIVLDVTLFTAVPVSAPNWASQPDLHRFWSEDVEVHADAERYQTTVAGRSYAAFPLLRRILMPTSAGDVTIDPFVLPAPGAPPLARSVQPVLLPRGIPDRGAQDRPASASASSRFRRRGVPTTSGAPSARSA